MPLPFCLSLGWFFELCKLLYLIWKRTFRAICWYKNLTNSSTDRYYLNVVLGPADLHQPPSTFWSVTLQPLVGYQPTMHHMKGDMYSFHMRHMSVIYYMRLQRYRRCNLLSVIGLVNVTTLSFSIYSKARLLVPCLIVHPSLLFKIGREWNVLSFHEVKLLGLLFRKALIIVQFFYHSYGV